VRLNAPSRKEKKRKEKKIKKENKEIKKSRRCSDGVSVNRKEQQHVAHQ